MYGIGRSNVELLLKEVQMEPNRRVKTLTDEEISKIAKAIDKNFLVEGNLRQNVSGNIKRLKEIGAYRGTRHARNLPTRGQRTKSNARTKRGKRSTVGAQKKDDRMKQTETKTETAEKK